MLLQDRTDVDPHSSRVVVVHLRDSHVRLVLSKLEKKMTQLYHLRGLLESPHILYP